MLFITKKGSNRMQSEIILHVMKKSSSTTTFSCDGKKHNVNMYGNLCMGNKQKYLVEDI